MTTQESNKTVDEIIISKTFNDSTLTRKQKEVLLTNYIGLCRAQAIGWTWAEACTLLDDNEDPRSTDQSYLTIESEEILNPKVEQESSRETPSGDGFLQANQSENPDEVLSYSKLKERYSNNV